MIPTPQTLAAIEIARPWRWTRGGPAARDRLTSSEPTAGAAYSRPSTFGPPSPSAIAGKSAIGMPKSIATMSTRYVPSSSWPAGRVAQAVEHAAQARRAPRRRRRHGPMPARATSETPKVSDVDAVGERAAPIAGDQHAAERRAGDHPERAAERRRARRGGQLLARDQPRQRAPRATGAAGRRRGHHAARRRTAPRRAARRASAFASSTADATAARPR